MRAIEKMIEKFEEMIEELDKQEPKDNVSKYLKESMLTMFCGLKMKAYQYLSEELKEELKK